MFFILLVRAVPAVRFMGRTMLMAMSAGMPVSVPMPVRMSMLMTMTAFSLACTRNERPREMLLHSLIRTALHAGYELNARLIKRRLCPGADAAADNEIDLRRMQEARNRAVALADRICSLRTLHRSVRFEISIIQPQA